MSCLVSFILRKRGKDTRLETEEAIRGGENVVPADNALNSMDGEDDK